MAERESRFNRASAGRLALEAVVQHSNVSIPKGEMGHQRRFKRAPVTSGLTLNADISLRRNM
jgi:hypothetical protein